MKLRIRVRVNTFPLHLKQYLIFRILIRLRYAEKTEIHRTSIRYCTSSNRRFGKHVCVCVLKVIYKYIVHDISYERNTYSVQCFDSKVGLARARIRIVILLFITKEPEAQLQVIIY